MVWPRCQGPSPWTTSSTPGPGTDRATLQPGRLRILIITEQDSYSLLPLAARKNVKLGGQNHICPIGLCKNMNVQLFPPLNLILNSELNRDEVEEDQSLIMQVMS